MNTKFGEVAPDDSDVKINRIRRRKAKDATNIEINSNSDNS
jgi:hypothetical protein